MRGEGEAKDRLAMGVIPAGAHGDAGDIVPCCHVQSAGRGGKSVELVGTVPAGAHGDAAGDVIPCCHDQPAGMGREVG